MPLTPSVTVSIHAPREGCDINSNDNNNNGTVSIHAPREGCDSVVISTTESIARFNSRTPGGVRLIRGAKQARSNTVSIHAPREGCDYAH